MTPNSFLAKLLRFTGIILMSLTAGFTLLGGAGTSCVALNPTGFGDSMAHLAPFQWLYILFVLAGIATGLMGIRAVVLLVRGRPESYQAAMLVLVAGSVVGILHIFVSRALRGSSMPVDAVVYTTLVTLGVFLLFRIPGVWSGVDYSHGKGKENTLSGGIAAILLGTFCATIPLTMGGTHTWGGVNYAGAFSLAMNLAAGSLWILGAILACVSAFHLNRSHRPEQAASYDAVTA